jgi:hypothetical protein
LCAQAEKWYLKLYVNLSQLEDRELLDAVQAFEDAHLEASSRGVGKPMTINILRSLEPIVTGWSFFS